MDASALLERMNEKVGPLPVIGWIAIGGVGVAILAARSRSHAAPTGGGGTVTLAPGDTTNGVAATPDQTLAGILGALKASGASGPVNISLPGGGSADFQLTPPPPPPNPAPLPDTTPPSPFPAGAVPSPSFEALDPQKGTAFFNDTVGTWYQLPGLGLSATSALPGDINPYTYSPSGRYAQFSTTDHLWHLFTTPGYSAGTTAGLTSGGGAGGATGSTGGPVGMQSGDMPPLKQTFTLGSSPTDALVNPH